MVLELPAYWAGLDLVTALGGWLNLDVDRMLCKRNALKRGARSLRGQNDNSRKTHKLKPEKSFASLFRWNFAVEFSG